MPRNMFFDHILLLISITHLCILSQISASSPPEFENQCPMDLNYVLTIPWDTSSCHNIISNQNLTSNCCQTLTSLYGVATAKHLKQTSLFRLPNLQTSISCLSDFQDKLNHLNLPDNLTSLCFSPENFVNTTNVCANIQTKQDWITAVGRSTPLDTGCSGDLSSLSACDECVQAGFQVQSELIALDGNSSRSRGCFYYTILYAAGLVNEDGPQSAGVLSCILGLPLLTQTDASDRDNRGIIYGSVGGGVTALVITILLVLLLNWSDGTREQTEIHDFSNLESSYASLKENDGLMHWRPKADLFLFTNRDLEIATNKFSPKNLIGSGQFGMVYKGKMQDGMMIAVKKITDPNSQGDFEFFREVEIISSLKHRNLVPLRGCCISDEESQKYLVYDYMANGNLGDSLFPPQRGWSRVGKRPLSWIRRKTIILDVANALAYLHYGVKPPIYHRDIKPTNILLDSHMRARVADFGLAKRIDGDESHLTTRIAGTHGYLAPEYALYGQLTEKSDVYSFGMVVLEVMCGRKALDLSSSTFLVTDWAWSLMKAGKLEQVLDPFLLQGDEYSVADRRYSRLVMERFVLVGILCAHLMVALRPTIVDALKMLEGDIEVPTIPDRPYIATDNMIIQ